LIAELVENGDVPLGELVSGLVIATPDRIRLSRDSISELGHQLLEIHHQTPW